MHEIKQGKVRVSYSRHTFSPTALLNQCIAKVVMKEVISIISGPLAMLDYSKCNIHNNSDLIINIYIHHYI